MECNRFQLQTILAWQLVNWSIMKHICMHMLQTFAKYILSNSWPKCLQRTIVYCIVLSISYHLHATTRTSCSATIDWIIFWMASLAFSPPYLSGKIVLKRTSLTNLKLRGLCKSRATFSITETNQSIVQSAPILLRQHFEPGSSRNIQQVAILLVREHHHPDVS